MRVIAATRRYLLVAVLPCAVLYSGACEPENKIAVPLPTADRHISRPAVILRALALTGVPDDAVFSIFAPSGVTTWRWRFARRERDEFATIDWYRGPGKYSYRLQSPSPVRLLTGTFYVGPDADHIRFHVIPCDPRLPYSRRFRLRCKSASDVHVSWTLTMQAHAAVGFQRRWTPAILQSPLYTVVNNSNAPIFPGGFSRTFLGRVERWNGSFFESYFNGGKCGTYTRAPPLAPHGFAWSFEPYTFGGVYPFHSGRYRYVTSYSLTDAANAVEHQLEDRFVIQ